jgi:serine/threonine protein kinase
VSTERTEPGSIVGGRFELERLLGAGGEGAVWAARDRKTGLKMAVKLLHPRYRFGGDARDRMRNEARALAELSHPNIVHYVAADLECASPWLAMELVDGRSLAAEMSRRWSTRRNFSLEEVVSIIEQIASALEHAHAKSIIHRDLKPHNVLVLNDGSVRVLDLGLAKLLQDPSDATTKGRALGTWAYMAPEQARGGEVDLRVDVFALGVITFELLTLHRAWAIDARGQPIPADGEPPPDIPANQPLALIERVTKGPRPKASLIRWDVPKAADATIAKALSPNPELRQRRAGLFARQLANAVRDRPFITFTATRASLLASAALALGIALVVGFAMKNRPRHPRPSAPELPLLRAVPGSTSEAEKEAIETVETIEPSSDERSKRPPAKAKTKPTETKAAPAKPRGPHPALVAARTKLAELRQDPKSADRLQRLREQIAKAAEEVKDPVARRTILRLSTASGVTGDLAGFDKAIAELETALAR